MSKTAEVLNELNGYSKILSYIQKKDGVFSSWYCGITKNIQQRLHGDHNVPKNHWFIHIKCVNNKVARGIEKAFLNHGCDGGPGGGDEDAVHVYAYLKTSTTNP